MSVLNFFRKIIYYKCAETPSELAEREHKVLQEILGILNPPFNQTLTKECPKCHISKSMPRGLGKYICLNCKSIFIDEEAQRLMKDMLDKSHLNEESQRRIKGVLDETKDVLEKPYLKGKPSK